MSRFLALLLLPLAALAVDAPWRWQEALVPDAGFDLDAAQIIDSQEQVGGYPKLEPTARPLDVPATNRRAWLEQLAREVTYGQAPAH